MSMYWNTARRAAFGIVLGFGLLAAGGLAAKAQAPQGAAADNGIVGIAIGLTADTVGAPAQLVVERVFQGPAQAAGVRAGDEIVAIDGQPVSGKSLRDVVHMVRGKVGSTVTLTLSQEGEKHDVSLKRIEPAPPHRPLRQPVQ